MVGLHRLESPRSQLRVLDMSTHIASRTTAVVGHWEWRHKRDRCWVRRPNKWHIQDCTLDSLQLQGCQTCHLDIHPHICSSTNLPLVERRSQSNPCMNQQFLRSQHTGSYTDHRRRLVHSRRIQSLSKIRLYLTHIVQLQCQLLVSVLHCKTNTNFGLFHKSSIPG